VSRIAQENSVIRAPETYEELVALANPSILYATIVLDVMSGLFDIWANRQMCLVWNDDDVHDFDRWLSAYGERALQALRGSSPSPGVDLDHVVGILRVRLIARAAHWRAEARAQVDDRNARPGGGDRPASGAELLQSPDLPDGT